MGRCTRIPRGVRKGGDRKTGSDGREGAHASPRHWSHGCKRGGSFSAPRARHVGSRDGQALRCLVSDADGTVRPEAGNSAAGAYDRRLAASWPTVAGSRLRHGYLPGSAAPAGFDVTGLDSAPAMLEAARATARRGGGSASGPGRTPALRRQGIRFLRAVHGAGILHRSGAGPARGGPGDPQGGAHRLSQQFFPALAHHHRPVPERSPGCCARPTGSRPGRRGA